MQHETPVGLHRATEIHGQIGKIGLLQGDVDALEKGGEAHVRRPVHDDAHRAVFVVFGDVGERAREVRIGHGGHGDQEVVGEVDCWCSHGRYFKPRSGDCSGKFSGMLASLH